MIPRLCHVPAGEFIMGREPEQPFTQEAPPREVHLDRYYIDETPVTCAQYQIFVQWIRATADHSSCHPDEPSDRDHRPVISNPDLFFQRDQPITGIDWFDAYAFAAWAGMRLPTEAEWEKAARGIDGRLWPWGNETGLRDGRLQAWYDDDGYQTPHRRLAGVYDHTSGMSPCGCFDMAGNVWEVCLDSFDEHWYSRMPLRNPRNLNPADMVVIRGGCWEYNEHDAMCAIRAGFKREVRGPTTIVGFRCASDVPNPRGAIGDMRHLKTVGESVPPADTAIVDGGGGRYYDGDDIDQEGLFLSSGDPAPLNDFLLLSWAPPPLDWMHRFSDVDLRADLRKPFEVEHFSPERVLAERYAATGSERARQQLADVLERLVEPLLEPAGVLGRINIQPEPLSSLNGYVLAKDGGQRTVVVHAGLLAIHERLGFLLGLLLEERADPRESTQYIEGLQIYVQTGGRSGPLPPNPSTGILPSAWALHLSSFMTTWVLAHELGHIALRHQPPGLLEKQDRRWEQECEADSFAVRVARDTAEAKEFQHLFGAALGFWAEFERACEIHDQGTETHPPMSQRIGRLLQAFPDLEKNFGAGMVAARSILQFS